jgi:hypothetical protein
VDVAIATTLANAATYYTISYTPANPDYNGKFRKVLLTLPGHPGYALRTRDGYYAVPKDAHLPPAEVAGELGSALDSPLAYMALPIPVIYAHLFSGPDHATLWLQIPSSALAWSPNTKGGNRARVWIAAAGVDASGKIKTEHKSAFEVDATQAQITQGRSRLVSLSFKLPVRMPVDHVRVVVRDEDSGHIGSAELTHLATPTGPEPDNMLKKR